MQLTRRFDATVKLFVLAMVFLAWHAVCQANGGHIVRIDKLEGGYSIRVPDHLRTTYTSPVEDFALYSLRDSKSGKVLLTIYIGNHPEPAEERRSLFSKSSKQIGGFAATSAKWSCNKNKFCGEVRIQLLSGEGWPAFAHLFYKNLSQDELAMVEDIIEGFGKEQKNQSGKKSAW